MLARMNAVRALSVVSLLVSCAPPLPPKPLEAPPPAAPLPPQTAPITVPDYVHAAVSADSRSPEDRALDAGRKPEQMLSFFGIAPGMKVAELGAGLGYTTELLARVVGPSGKVYGQNSHFVLEKFAEAPWSARLKKPEMSNVLRIDRESDDPLPPDASELDAVLSILVYHDTVWLGTDRDKMNQAVFKALKHGGVYGIVDHSAQPGTGLSGVKTVHRIDESTLKSEVEHAGFQLAAEADFLRNPLDKRDWNDSPREAGERRGTSDRFVLKFVKP
jgi:predicted methyltransferase